jgi:hypothetical protein
MNSRLRRARRSAFLAIVAAACVHHPLAAQQSPLTPTAIGQMVDEVVDALIPPNQTVSRVPVAKRKVFFDDQRTMALFQHLGAPPASLADLHLRTAAKPGSKSLLDDCDHRGQKPCSQLGWGVYMWIQPISVTNSEALVRAYFAWPDRGGAAFEEGVAPKGRAALVGFATDVRLVRSPSGNWKFASKGATMVGE